MKLTSTRLAVAMAVLIGGSVLLSSVHAADMSVGRGEEYAVIQWWGTDKTQILYPDGKVEFLSTLMPGTHVDGPTHERAFIMTQLMNKLAKEGYSYAGMASGEEIVMVRKR